MKRQIFIAIIALLGLAATVNAQEERRQAFNPKTGRIEKKTRHGIMGDRENIYYGARIGLSFASLQSSIAFNENTPEVGSYGGMKTSVSIGAVIGFNLVRGLSFETGLGYVGKGGIKKSAECKWKYNLDYLELPLVFKYRFDVGSNFGVEPLLGGYLAYGLGGKWRYYAPDEEDRDSHPAFGDDPRLRRWDAGLKFGCAAEYSVFYLELAYDLGLANVSHDDFDGTHNRNLLLSLGVNF